MAPQRIRFVELNSGGGGGSLTGALEIIAGLDRAPRRRPDALP